MDRVLSVEGIAELLWTTPPLCQLDNNSDTTVKNASASAMMIRSSSEWALRQFIQENNTSDHHSPVDDGEDDETVEIRDHLAGPPNVRIDSDVYQAFLKSRLDLACAAVAMTRQASIGKPQDTSTSTDSGSKVSNASLVNSQLNRKGSGSSSSKRKYKDGPIGNPSLQAKRSKPMVQVKSTTSSSRELSDDNELEECTDITRNMDHTNDKRVRRMMSNRESARRSRTRKQAHVTDLETQVAQLRVENSSLSKRLTEISQMFNEADVDNRVLKADVETLRAKLKMAEETVKRVRGQSPIMFQTISEASTFNNQSYDTSTDAAVPVQNDPSHHIHVYQQHTSNDPRASNNSSTKNSHRSPSSSPEPITLSENKIGGIFVAYNK
ncbi:unnamed protein product [Rhodiola kirilowii]